MATAREARAERLNDRLRGAQRVNLGDDSFNLDIPGLDPAVFAAPQPPSSPRQPGSSSAKRRRLNNEAPDPASSDRSGGGGAPKDPYDIPNTSKDSQQPAKASATTGQHAGGRDTGGSSSPRNETLNHVPDSEGEPEDEPDELEVLPEPSSTSASGRPSRVRSSFVEEIEESPVSKPGSGRRRTVAVSSALASSARLRDEMGSDSSMPSSPLTRKSRRSDAELSDRRASRLSVMEELQFDEIDEIASQLLSQAQERSPSRELGSAVEPGEMEVVPAPDDEEEEEEEEEEEAEEISAAEAARALRGRRPRQSLRSGSIELGSRDRGEGDEDDYEEEEEAPEPVPEPAPRRQRGKPNKSPATQKQPAQKPRKRTSQKQKPEKPRPTAPPKPRRSSGARRKSDEGSAEDGGEGENAIEVTVQRFVNFRKRRRNDDEEADDIDPLQLDIPFANSSRENAVDVFAQVCEEVIGNTLSQFEQHAQNAPDVAKKKEFRIKIRAVEAYREVLKSRLLQHAIHLNHWHSLRKRVRQTQKEKLALREEILRIKGEREQVALRMDAVRAKHEADNKEATFLLNTSSTMYDIDMAVSKGQDAPQLSGKAQKEAELSNLEFLVAQLTDQVSSSSESGGNLHQVQDFNAFLERAAQALESR
ncbi:unnamed protein product [Clonostachys chloroleuca]|uniref:Inner kinetochore subunit AME1 domain-containing protein n=1 Tax=Clonostachys chloroleuca TaxID=1926264 RepID=A0AA35M628_9HYPO|nr:unnamed protein product [Clonostachys chloroleuca]